MKVISRSLAAALLFLMQAACVSQSVGPDGVHQSVGPFHQDVGPGSVSQGAGPYGPSQSVGPGGVQQSAGPYGPSQSVGPTGVQQSSGGAPPSACDIQCAGKKYSASCSAASGKARCQCASAPYASCVKPARAK